VAHHSELGLTPSLRHQVTGGVVLCPEEHMTDLMRNGMSQEDRHWNSGLNRL